MALFDTLSFSGIKLKNRIVRSATYEKRADEDGFATESLINLYEALARGGAGLIISGIALVHPGGRALPQMISVHGDQYIKGLKELTGRVHAEGGVMAVQLGHGGRQSPPVLLGGAPPLAPSAVPDPSSGITPRSMTDEEIWQTIYAFGDAARRGADAGFDAVQIHAAHGFLVNEFISPHTNRRDDYWGGDEERRFHYLEEVYLAIRKEVGEGYPVLIKQNGDDLLPGGLLPEESLRIAKRLEALGLDAIEISGGMRESPIRASRPDILKPGDEAYFRDIGALFKAGLKIPVIVTGGMRSRAVMEEVLSRGEADLIGLARPFIREPELPNKFKAGKAKADCISCNKCYNHLQYETIECLSRGQAPPAAWGQAPPAWGQAPLA